MNAQGRAFIEAVRRIAAERYNSDSDKRAHVTAFAILVLIDGSGESYEGFDFRVVTAAGDPVIFNHHDL